MSSSFYKFFLSFIDFFIDKIYNFTILGKWGVIYVKEESLYHFKCSS